MSSESRSRIFPPSSSVYRLLGRFIARRPSLHPASAFSVFSYSGSNPRLGTHSPCLVCLVFFAWSALVSFVSHGRFLALSVVCLCRLRSISRLGVSILPCLPFRFLPFLAVFQPCRLVCLRPLRFLSSPLSSRFTPSFSLCLEAPQRRVPPSFSRPFSRPLPLFLFLSLRLHLTVSPSPCFSCRSPFVIRLSSHFSLAPLCQDERVASSPGNPQARN